MKETKPYQGKVTVEKYSNAVLMESGRILCTANPSTFSQHSEEANAAQIARRWNAHDSLVEALEGIVNYTDLLLTAKPSVDIERIKYLASQPLALARKDPATVK